MTFSILAHDEKSGAFMGAAATGSLCVGGWVLRGDIDSGLVASQGTAPSTFWRDEALRRLNAGQGASEAVLDLTGADSGRGHRQLAAIDRQGSTGAFTGAASVEYAGHHAEPGLVVSGNMLAGAEVLDALLEVARTSVEDPAARMITALRAAEAAGSDVRGLRSAALLVLHPDFPPLDLRIDQAADPVGALATLLGEVRMPPYADWLDVVPVQRDRFRAPEEQPKVEPLEEPPVDPHHRAIR
ncbi:DUF1028 domain-containing protein [Pseudoroseicyclus tamaricis]|uniref:DUF1028 domain-containing protein n=1 Tax=Pseudoroseicyclus tamaricis TaxID=2705421 RepID=A0A6B2JSR5_9RHOB|nr:DUF1028 domain-containing protein [Pseudoroseicyclus tamaricis]NDV01607.1 DUF1028 domain-containing protein [Pseudoroseicyclus tamaricis]